MTSRTGHPGDDLQVLIDGRLDAVRRQEVEEGPPRSTRHRQR